MGLPAPTPSSPVRIGSSPARGAIEDGVGGIAAGATVSRITKCFVWLMLGLILNGCTGYRATHLPNPSTDPRAPKPDHEAIAVGDKIKVIMTDGEEYRGRVKMIGMNDLTLENPSEKEGGEDLNLERARISSIEKKKVSFGKTAGLILIVSVAWLAALLASPAE